MTSPVESLQVLVRNHRSRWLRLEWARAGGVAVAVCLGAFLTAVLLDSFFRLSSIGRIGVALTLLGVFGWMATRIWAFWNREHPTDDEVALAIERRTASGLQNRLINAIQIGRDIRSGHSPAGTELVEQNWRHLEQSPLNNAARVGPAVAAVIAAVAALLVFLVGFVVDPLQFKTAASRILMPFASIDPLYRTRLTVEPGDVEASGDVPVQIRIEGEVPEELAILLETADRRSSIVVKVPARQTQVSATIPDVVRSVSYAVRGGDFVTPYYRIEVPTAPRLIRVRARLNFPDYVQLPEQAVETSGDLEALRGTKAVVRFELDHPVDSAQILSRRVASSQQSEPRRIPLKMLSGDELEGSIEFDSTHEYQVETRIGDRTPRSTAWHTVRVVADLPPKLELSGVPSTSELPVETPVPLRVSVTDDFGLRKYGIYFRRPSLSLSGVNSLERSNSGHSTRDDKPADPETDWKPLAEWDGTERKVSSTADFFAETLGFVEGDRLELTVRAKDTAPERQAEWTIGPVLNVMVIGEGAQLQFQYEQILRTEAELSALLVAAAAQHKESDLLVRRLNSGDLVDDNSSARIEELNDSATIRSKESSQLRETAARIAREMSPAAGSLRLSLGMLADTEMVRAVRVLDSVSTRENAMGRRTSLTEARATQFRAHQSLQQIFDQYVKFRHDWELAHMTPFVRMLADRQSALRDQSKQRADAGRKVAMTLCDASVKRQYKLSELSRLAGTAFLGIAERTAEIEPQLAETFGTTSERLGAESLKTAMTAAADAMMSSEWSVATQEADKAAMELQQIVESLQQAQSEAARRAIAALEDRKESDLDAQAALEKLKAGDGEDLLDEPAGLKLSDIIHAAEVAQNKNAGEKPEIKPDNYLFPDSAIGSLQQPDSGKRQQFEILKLATAPSGTPSFPNQSDRKGNKVKPHIQEEFEDLVGDLLEEEDEMKANYETYNLNAAFNINEPGEIGKQGGDLNSTAAAAATGNMKPPTTNVGGASRVGRQGARAFGAAMGNESINRRGRDKVQEGQERTPDQAGSVKETKSDDPQEDTSTGIGGRKVESDDAKFSQNDSGEFTEDMVGRMEKSKEKHFIVERQGKGVSADIADAMRDMTSKQEQTLERLKSIRKELKNLYLPTEHLDELIQRMQANLQTLSERPTADVYHLQQQTLDELRGAVQVFHQAHSGFQASLPRDQSVKGRVLDDPARSAPPGYEEAVQLYFQKLSTR